MELSNTLFEVKEGVARLTLNRPKQLNSINMELIDESRWAIAQTNDNPEARVLLITGAGRAFCAGADLKSRGGDPPRADMSSGELTAYRMETAFNPLFNELHDCRVPIVTAVNGVAAGGGVGFALAGDIVIAARSATFIQVFTPQLGLIPDCGCTWHLPRLVGRARAVGLAFLGDRLSAEKAEEWGLIWKCVDDEKLMAEAEAVADQLKQGPTQAYREVRKALDSGANLDFAGQLDYERDRQKILADSADFMEGVMAFVEKRKPAFKGA